MSFHKASGRWEWSVLVGYDDNGKPMRTRGYARTKTEATEVAQQLTAKKRRGGFVPTGRDISVGDHLDAWIEHRIKPHREPKTIAFYDANIRCHLKPAIGNVPLRQLSAQHVQKMINAAVASGRSASTVHGILRTLRSALQVAWKEDLIEQNVAQKVTMPKLEQRDPEFLGPEAARKLIEAAEGHPLQNLFTFALSTGLRLGEVTGLTWDCVDLNRRQITVAKQLQRIGSVLQLKGLKSKSSRRTLAVSGMSLQALRDELSRQLIMKAEMGSEFNSLNLVFLNSEQRPLDPKYINNHLRALCVKAEITPVSFHKLRHTAATLMVAAGVELHQVKEQLGHSQIALTANLYAHGVTEAQRKAVNILDGVLRSGELPE